MIIKYTQEEYNKAKPTDLLKLQCQHCSNLFLKSKHNIQKCLNPKTINKGDYCSVGCRKLSRGLRIPFKCKNCGGDSSKNLAEYNRSKNNFCSRSCAATYNNKNKTHGTRRSKLEAYIEEQLPTYFPQLEIIYNGKEAIGSELDIYIPSLNLAFELNGIFHYEPVFGKRKHDQIVANDRSKMKGCIDNKIDLCIIDTCAQKYFKPKTSQKYIDIIVKIINDRLSP